MVIRPNPLQWIWYTFGGRRQAMREVAQVAPGAMVVAALLCLESGLGWVVFGGIACGGLLSLWYYMQACR
jgi:hypothetical protein